MVRTLTRGVLRGAKINKRHSTYTPYTGKLIQFLKNLEEVKKVILGPITPASSSYVGVKTRMDNYTVRITVRDVTAIQIIWVTGIPIEVLDEKIAKWREVWVKSKRI